MIEIIKRGDKRISKCRFCGCEFSFEYGDSKIIDIPCQDYEELLNCPQCNNSISVKNAKTYRIKNKWGE